MGGEYSLRHGQLKSFVGTVTTIVASLTLQKPVVGRDFGQVVVDLVRVLSGTGSSTLLQSVRRGGCC